MTQVMQKPGSHIANRALLAWAYQDLNLGPLRYQRSALTT